MNPVICSSAIEMNSCFLLIDSSNAGREIKPKAFLLLSAISLMPIKSPNFPFLIKMLSHPLN